MRKLTVFNNISLDGYIADEDGDMSWAHNDDAEWQRFTNSNASHADGTLLFGRKTYQMMASYWPTPAAQKAMPKVAAGMNAMHKVVFSKKKLKRVSWQNTTLLRGNLVGEVKALKKAKGGDIVVMGSGSIIAQLADANLIDELTVAIHPVVLGGGKSMFAHAARSDFERTSSKLFKNGNVVVTYAAK